MPKELDFFYDLGSPYGYLGLTHESRHQIDDDGQHQRNHQAGDDREREVLASDVAGQPSHPSQAPRSKPEEQADRCDGEAYAHQQLAGVGAHLVPEALRPSPLEPKSMLRNVDTCTPDASTASTR